MVKMSEHENRRYVAEITSDKNNQRMSMDVIIDNVDREAAEKIILEMEAVKEKIKYIMAG